jgi:amidase
VPPANSARSVCYTRRMHTITAEQTGAFIERFSLQPTSVGPLGGLQFVVKDLIDVAGHRTGCGNPAWLESAPPASVSAVCVEQLLAAGARCEGKTITDELAFSLLGENFHYGTPLNPAAPDRVPGGSSSGSASAVACGLAGFALGTDTGGSVRVPSSNCGIWGWRPTHGFVSVAGVAPLAPSFDTVGILARSAEVLQLAANVLLTCDHTPSPGNATVYIVAEPFALADEAVRTAFHPALDLLTSICGQKPRETTLRELCTDDAVGDMETWANIYRMVTGAEAVSSYGSWLASAQPELGPMAAAGFKFAHSIDRTQLNEVIGQRERYARCLRAALGRRDLLCIPTAPTVAPLKGSKSRDRNSDYYRRTLALNAIAGVGRLPQVSMPLAKVDGVPIGLSLIAAHGEDNFLLNFVNTVSKG